MDGKSLDCTVESSFKRVRITETVESIWPRCGLSQAVTSNVTSTMLMAGLVISLGSRRQKISVPAG